mgnify:CR=1 FL=1
MAVDCSVTTIEKLFQEQISKLTKKANKIATFDMQFSEWWLR